MARKKTAKKVATRAAKKTTRNKTTTPSAPRTGGESALTGQGPSWWKLGKPLDPGYRRAVEDDQPTRSSRPAIPAGIYPQPRQPAEPLVQSGLELFGTELEELDSEHMPDDLIPLDAELTTDVDDLLNGEHDAIESLVDGSLEDLLSEVVPEVVPEDALDEHPDDDPDDDPDVTEYFPPDIEDLLEVPQDVLDVVEKEMPVEDDLGIADPSDFVDISGVADELATEPAAVEEFPELPEPPTAETPSVEEPPAEAMSPAPVEPVPAVPVETAVAKQEEPAEPDPAPSPAGLPLLVTVLQGLNYPLRALSPSSRVVVDWVAWSLIFWVPVVWTIAIVVVGR